MRGSTLAGIAGALAVAWAASAASAAVVFSDDFSTSTVNANPAAAPTSTSTAYQVLSAKAWNPTPSIATGDLKFGIGSTSSGAVEVQGLFTSTPVALGSAGDYVELSLTFTDTSGILTGAGALGIGMYNSGGSAPIAGGLNGTASTSGTDHVSDGVNGWQGYVAQLGYTGSTSRIMDRQAQSGGTANNDQDLVTSGSSSQSYRNPGASTVGSSSGTSALTLTAGNQYTEVLRFTLTADGLQVDSNFYDGATATGSPLATLTGVAASPLTTSFDGLAIGWRETGSQATTMDINALTVTSNVGGATPEPASLSLLGLGALGLLGRRRRA